MSQEREIFLKIVILHLAVAAFPDKQYLYVPLPSTQITFCSFMVKGSFLIKIFHLVH